MKLAVPSAVLDVVCLLCVSVEKQMFLCKVSFEPWAKAKHARLGSSLLSLLFLEKLCASSVFVCLFVSSA